MYACWSTKGGSGTTVVAAALALSRAATGASVRLVDFAGDLPAALGIVEPDSPGVTDWLVARDATTDDLMQSFIPVTSRVTLLPLGTQPTLALTDADAMRLAHALATDASCTIVDVGTHPNAAAICAQATKSILIVRPCYLALRRATRSTITSDSVIVVQEPGRALTTRDIEGVVGTKVTATIPVDPTIARAVDAGLLSSRLPIALATAIAGWA